MNVFSKEMKENQCADHRAGFKLDFPRKVIEQSKRRKSEHNCNFLSKNGCSISKSKDVDGPIEINVALSFFFFTGILQDITQPL